MVPLDLDTLDSGSGVGLVGGGGTVTGREAVATAIDVADQDVHSVVVGKLTQFGAKRLG